MIDGNSILKWSHYYLAGYSNFFCINYILWSDLLISIENTARTLSVAVKWFGNCKIQDVVWLSKNQPVLTRKKKEACLICGLEIWNWRYLNNGANDDRDIYEFLNFWMVSIPSLISACTMPIKWSSCNVVTMSLFSWQTRWCSKVHLQELHVKSFETDNRPWDWQQQSIVRFKNVSMRFLTEMHEGISGRSYVAKSQTFWSSVPQYCKKCERTSTD